MLCYLPAEAFSGCWPGHPDAAWSHLMSEPVLSPGESCSYLNGCEYSFFEADHECLSLKGTVLPEGDFSSFYCAYSCVVLGYPAVFIACSAFPYTTGSDNSSSYSAWSPPLNITP